MASRYYRRTGNKRGQPPPTPAQASPRPPPDAQWDDESDFDRIDICRDFEKITPLEFVLYPVIMVVMLLLALVAVEFTGVPLCEI
jgi:hypothetical protein